MSEPEFKNEDMGANDEVLLLNGLKYEMPQSLSTVLNRTMIKNYANRNEFKSGETIIFDLNTGSRYISPEECALKFTVELKGSGTGALSSAGIACLIRELRIFSKSGTELDRVQDLNQYVYHKQQYEESSDSLLKYGELYGGLGATLDAGEVLNVGTPDDFLIPMNKISGLFKPTVAGMMLPPGIIGGARIELVLETVGRAIADPSSTVTDFVITNPELHLMSSELSSNTQRILNEEASTNGLEYTYTRVFSASQTTDSTSINIQCKKAVSQALRVFCAPKLNANVDNIAVNSFSSSIAGDSNIVNYYYRVGSNFHPQQRVNSNKEAMWVTQGAYAKHEKRGWYSSGLGFTDYLTYFNGVGVGLETHTRINLAGVPLSNSQVLELQASVIPAGGQSVKYYIFLEYVCVARGFLTNCTVKI
jgi:hypothetical protein